MDGLSRLVDINRIALESWWMRVEYWAVTRLLTWAAAEQLVILLAALLLAWLLARPLEGWARHRVALRSRWMEQSLKMLAFAAIRLSFPLLALLLLWLWIGAMERIGLEVPLVRTVASLLTAWIGIRLLATVIRNDLLARLVAALAWAVAALSILDLLEPAILFLDRAALQIGQLRLSVLGLLKAALMLGVLLWAASVVSRILERRLRELRSIGPSAQVLIGKLIKTGFVAVAVLLALNMVGIDLTALAVLTGAIGLGVGFGLQKVVSNLISGMILLLDRSIKPGDVIEIGNSFGWVSKLGARYVAVTTRDGVDWLIPNEDLITHRVTNWSFDNDLLRLRLPFRVAFDADLRQAMALAIEAAQAVPRVVKDPAPVCRLMNFGESAIELELRVWICDPENGVVNVRSDVLLGLWDRLRAAGVRVPFPQRDVHLRTDAREPGRGPPIISERAACRGTAGGAALAERKSGTGKQDDRTGAEEAPREQAPARGAASGLQSGGMKPGGGPGRSAGSVGTGGGSTGPGGGTAGNSPRGGR